MQHHSQTHNHAQALSVTLETGHGMGQHATADKENMPGSSKIKVQSCEQTKPSGALKSKYQNAGQALYPDPLNTYPEYTQNAKRLGLEAKMVCTLQLKVDGSVQSLLIDNEENQPLELVQIVKTALQQWKYKSPHSLVGVKIRVPIDFSLQD